MEKDVYTVQDLLFNKDLEIPEYQRPYKWRSNKHVAQLLKDVHAARNNKKNHFRIGTVLLHYNENKSKYEVVDGQQRLITLSLILYALDKTENSPPLLNTEFRQNISKKYLKENFNYIENFIQDLDKEEQNKFHQYLNGNCEFVVIPIKKLSEAFQLFDSQNARGKDLNPEDLLKAYHLREMQDNSTEEKKACVNHWEQAIDKNNSLNDLISNYLFRLRNWQKHEWKYFFNKDEIEEFKGINFFESIKENKKYPYLQIAYQNSLSQFFQIDEVMINGRRFFDYTHHYNDQLTLLRNAIKEEGGAYNYFELNYPGSHRIGDQRLIALFETILLLYIDKFGYDPHFENFAKALYRWTFIDRLKQKQIRYQTIINKIKEKKNNPIRLIRHWYEPDILDFKSKLPKFEDIKIEKNIDQIEYKIKEFQNG